MTHETPTVQAGCFSPAGFPCPSSLHSGLPVLASSPVSRMESGSHRQPTAPKGSDPSPAVLKAQAFLLLALCGLPGQSLATTPCDHLHCKAGASA